MPTALSDPSPTLYLILIILALALAGIWLRRQTRGDLVRFLIALGALVGVYLIDRFVESPREESSRKIEEMAKASRDKKWDDLFKHVSDSFIYKRLDGSEVDKKTLREKLKLTEDNPHFKGVVILDIDRADYDPVGAKTITVGFQAGLREVLYPPVFVVATFAKEADGQWRMTEFKRYDSIRRLGLAPIEGLD